MQQYSHHLSLLEAEFQNNQFIGMPFNLYEPLNYMMSLGGKRIRPLLVLLGCDLYSGEISSAIPSALSVEIFHNFSLIHDDIMDNAPLRRGNTAVHKKWDANNAILSGDLMLVKAYECLSKSDEKYFLDLYKIFGKTAAQVCEGQQMDMNFEKQSLVTEEEYLEMIKLKTSVLLGCSLKMGAIIGNTNNEEATRIYDLGVNLGMGFQLMDDYLDTFGQPELIGKQIGGDILSHKKTILSINAFEKNKSRFQSLNENGELEPAKLIQEMRNLFIETGSDIYLKTLSDSYFSVAYKNLDELDADYSKKTDLKNLISLLKDRKF